MNFCKKIFKVKYIQLLNIKNSVNITIYVDDTFGMVIYIYKKPNIKKLLNGVVNNIKNYLL